MVPLVDTLAACASQEGVASFHFPGHRRGNAAPPSLARLLGLAPFTHDLPELPELDNLFAPEGVISQAQSCAASVFGADSTFFLVNGSTCGIQAAIMATCPPGHTLILARNCHFSAFSGLVLSGAKPLYVMPGYDLEWDIAHGIDPEDVEKAFVDVRRQDEHAKIGALLITSPTYHGVSSDVKRIADICHKYGVPLIVDEAHGAHFQFHDEFPKSALQQDADIVIQSTHKVLSSLTQSAMLHVRGNMIDSALLRKCLQTLQSSSPNYLLLASLDASREHASTSARAALSTALQLAEEARKLLVQIKGVEVLSIKDIQDKGSNCAKSVDPLRITVSLREIGLSGFEVDDILRLKYQVIAELPSLQSITFAVSLGTTHDDINSLVAAFRAIAKGELLGFPNTRRKKQDNPSPSFVPGMDALSISMQSRILTPREAYFAASERIHAEAACGRVCSELVCPYPPGIPLLVPGERICREAVDVLKAIYGHGGYVTGASDNSMETFLVCKDAP
ncbi:hypothetical protein KP509_03G005400 [Ceratopteris richardii]|nr:hypothetical protein KP509_03G005400 [Ceratopteris richardii]